MLRIVSKASSVESFMQLFRRFCDRESVFIATRTPKGVGTRARFVVSLSTGQPMIAGQGEVIEAYGGSDNPHGRPGMRMRFLELDEPSRRTVETLVGENAAGNGRRPPLPGLPTPPQGSSPPQGAQPLGMMPTVPHVIPGQERPSAQEQGLEGSGEDRARGSELVLPANPFAELSNESLEAFIECSMYEDVSSGLEPSSGESQRYRAVTWWPPTGMNSALPPGLGGIAGPTSSLQPSRSQPEAAAHGQAGPSPMASPTTSMPGPVEPVSNRRQPIHTAVIAHSRRTSPWRMAIGAILLSAVVGLGVGYLLWGSARTRAHAPLHESADASAPAVMAADGGAAAGDAPDEAAGGKPAASPEQDSDAAAAAASDECNVKITSRPDEASVYVGGARLGETPLKTILPCGRTKVAFERPRYRDVTEVATLRAGARNRVHVRLRRPRVTLKITSSPPGAMVFVNRKRVGRTPVSVEIPGFRRTRIVVRKSGYRRFRKRIYPKPPRAELHADLSRRRR